MNPTALLRAACILLLGAFALHAEVPSLINYQGRLTDAQGNPVTGNRTMAVRIYDAPTGGNMTYEETIGTVAVANGTYSFQFGGAGDGIIGVLSGSDYLALSVDGTEESTRTRLLAVPYALKAKESADAQALVQQVAELEAANAGFVSSVETVASNLTANMSAAQQQVADVAEQLGGLLSQFKVVGTSGDLAFGNSTTTRSFEITNTGFGRLHVTGIEYPAGFSGDWNGGIINQGGSAWVNVTFAPESVGTFGGNITILSDATSGSGSIAASGEGARPISLQGDLAFGNATVNSTFTPQRTLYISNPGTMALTVSSISYPVGFSGNWSGTIAPGATQNVTVVFAPTAAQSYGGNLVVSSDATGGSGVLAVSGAGVAPVPPSANMVTVQGGTLPPSSGLSGTPVSTFQIGKYEVTWAEWQEMRTWALANGYGNFTTGGGSAAAHPVRDVSWYDVVKYCNARSEREGLVPVYSVNGTVYRSGEFGWNGSSVVAQNLSANGYRLPTEAEWEWAARGGVSSQGYTYSGSNDVNAVAWYYDNSSGAAVNLSGGRGTWPVGQKAANELGIHDMSGNVWEWCWDANGYIRRIRGGGWDYSASLAAVALRNNTLNSGYPDYRYNYIGFRMARSSGL